MALSVIVTIVHNSLLLGDKQAGGINYTSQSLLVATDVTKMQDRMITYIARGKLWWVQTYAN